MIVHGHGFQTWTSGKKQTPDIFNNWLSGWQTKTSRQLRGDKTADSWVSISQWSISTMFHWNFHVRVIIFFILTLARIISYIVTHYHEIDSLQCGLQKQQTALSALSAAVRDSDRDVEAAGHMKSCPKLMKYMAKQRMFKLAWNHHPSISGWSHDQGQGSIFENRVRRFKSPAPSSQ